MAWQIERSRDIVGDLESIFEFLTDSYQNFGDEPEMAYRRAMNRVRKIEDRLGNFTRTPFQGTLHNEISPDLRSVTKDRAIYWFYAWPESQRIFVVAIFFGAQDHHALMRKRIAPAD